MSGLIAMRHVEAKDVDPSFNQCAQLFFRTGSGADGGYNLRLSHKTLLARKIRQRQPSEHRRDQETPNIARAEMIGDIGLFAQVVQFF